jgi:hypothetical protein
MADRTEPERSQVATDNVKPADSQATPNPENTTPMLDVHAPHETIHTWKSFFIHIATIVIGLLIAIALEQTVEYLHHREQRHQLLEDLRHEAEERVNLMLTNNRVHMDLEKWYRDILRAALASSPVGGSATFEVPPYPTGGVDEKPEEAVWDAAKASGAVIVLSRSEIETWELVDYFTKRVKKDVETLQAAIRALRAATDHIGVSLAPGVPVRVSLEQRDELTRDLGNLIEAAHDLLRDEIVSGGASKAVLHGAQTGRQMNPYIEDALKALPH